MNILVKTYLLHEGEIEPVIELVDEISDVLVRRGFGNVDTSEDASVSSLIAVEKPDIDGYDTVEDWFANLSESAVVIVIPVGEKTNNE